MSILLDLWLSCAVLSIVAGIIYILEKSYADRPAQREAEKMQAMKRMHQDAIEQIDETADYYAGLYRYISWRLDEETRRRRSR